MAKSFSFDLRSRVPAAIADGLSCRQAADRFDAMGGRPEDSVCGPACRRDTGKQRPSAGLRLTGIAAPFVLDGAINRDAFETYVARVLVPELQPGDGVVMDNLSSHKGPRVKEMIDAAGASPRYLPPYSPDFNPIENAFATLKAMLRKTAARTVPALRTAIGSLVDTFTPAEGANYFKAAGYDAT